MTLYVLGGVLIFIVAIVIVILTFLKKRKKRRLAEAEVLKMEREKEIADNERRQESMRKLMNNSDDLTR